MKKIIIFFSGLFVLLFTLVLVAVFYTANFDPNEHKQSISDRFFEETGRTLTLEGDISLTIYPWLGLELSEVSVSNAPGFGEEPLFSTERAFVRIKLMPMLNQQYEIDTVLLRGTSLNLVINESGESNWSGLIKASETTDDNSSESGEFPLGNLALGGVDIQNANIIYDDRSSAQRFEISNLTITTGELVYGQPVQLNMSLDADSARPRLSAGIDFSGTVIYDLDEQQYELSPLSLNGIITGPNIPGGSTTLTLDTALSINLNEDTLVLSDLEFDALGTHLSANINGANIQSAAPTFDADLTLTGDDLALLFRIAEINDLADQIEGIASRNFDFSAAIQADLQQGNITLSGLNSNLLGASINGDLLATNLQTDSPGISGQLNASGPDLPTLLEVTGQIIGGSDSPLSQYGRQLGNISSKGFSINADFSADLATGNIDAPVLNADLLGFTLDGRLQAQNMNNNAGSVDGSLTVHSDSLGEVLSALGQTGLGEIVQTLDLSVGINGNPDNLAINPLQMNVVLDGPQIPNSPVTLGLQALSSVNLENDSLVVDEFILSGLGLNVGGDIAVERMSEAPEFAGNLAIAPFNLRQLLDQLNQNIPVTADTTTLQNVSLATSFQGSNTNFNLSNLTMVLDDSTLDGRFSLTDFENPALEYDINIDQIDADRYLPPESANQNNQPSGSSDLPLDTLRDLNVNGELTIGQLGILGLNITELVMGLNANGGVINLAPMQANLYQGSYSGAVNLDVSTATPRADIESNLTGVDVEPLMIDFMDAAYVSGIGNIDFSLSGSGADIATIKRNLNGRGSIALNDGVLQGVDVGSVLAQVETMIQSGRLLDVQRGQETAFNSISASININNGNVSSNDLLIGAPGFQVTGQGTLVDLNNDSINFQLLTSVDSSTATTADEVYDIGGYSLPITCTGYIDSPTCLPDLQAIIAEALTQAVSSGISDFLQRALGVEDAPAQDNVETNSVEEQNLEQEPAQTDDLEDQLINRALDALFR